MLHFCTTGGRDSVPAIRLSLLCQRTRVFQNAYNRFGAILPLIPGAEAGFLHKILPTCPGGAGQAGDNGQCGHQPPLDSDRDWTRRGKYCAKCCCCRRFRSYNAKMWLSTAKGNPW
jgi:hypothetical protein